MRRPPLDELKSVIVSISAPVVAEPNTIEDLSLSISTIEGIPLAADLTAGTITITRVRAGAEVVIINGLACTAANGRIYYAYTFPAASWQDGDWYKAVFTGQEVNIGTATYTLSEQRCKGVIADVAALALVVNGTYTVEVSSPDTVEPDTTQDLSLSISTPTGIPLAASLAPGTITITRVRAGVEVVIVAAAACVAANGRIYYSYTFPNASWTPGDEYKAVFTGQFITIYALSDIRCKGRVTRENVIANAAIAAAAYAILNSGLSFRGIVTSKAGCGVNDFIVGSLVGVGTGAFVDVTAPYRCFVFMKGDGTTTSPHGETQTMTAYVTGTAKITTAAFGAEVVVGDTVILMHPRIAELAVILADIIKLYAAADGVGNFPASVVDQSIISKILSKVAGGDTSSYDETTDSLEAISDALSLAVVYSGTFTTSSVSVPADTVCGVAYTQNGTFDNYFIRVRGGLATAALNQIRPIRLYTGTTGVFTLDRDFTAAPGLVAYDILGIPSQADRLRQIQGGSESIQSLKAELVAIPDVAEVRTLASPVTLTGALQYIYTNAPARPFFFAGGFMDRASGAWATAESVTIQVEAKIDGTNWRVIWAINFLAEPSPTLVAVPSHANSALLNLPYGFWNRGDGVRVGVVQSVVGAGYQTWNHSFLDAVPST